MEDDTALDVVVITEDKKQKLKNVFWDMHEITFRTSELLPERTLKTFLLSIVQAVIMSLSQQTAVSVLRKDRDAIKKIRQRGAFLYSFRCLYEIATQPRSILCCVALLLFFPCIQCRKIKKLLF